MEARDELPIADRGSPFKDRDRPAGVRSPGRRLPFGRAFRLRVAGWLRAGQVGLVASDRQRTFEASAYPAPAAS